MGTVLKVRRISDRAILPKYAHNGDMCFDLSVLIDGDNTVDIIDGDVQQKKSVIPGMDETGRVYVTIEPQQSLVFHTGLKMATEVGYGVKVHVRSSTGIKKNLTLANGTGVIDTATYRGELMIALINEGSTARRIYDQERVAQGEVQPVLEVEIKEVDTLNDTERGEGGIGSTGGH